MVSEARPLHASRREAWLVWGVMTPLLGLFFAAAKLFLYASFRSGYDLRARVGVIANLTRGEGFLNPEQGTSLLGEHFEPALVGFVPFFRLGVGAEALLIAQALAGAMTVALGWLLIRDVLRRLPRVPGRGAALVLLLLYAVYRPFLSAVAFDFHLTTVAMPLVAAAALALRRGADAWLWLLVGVLLSTRENAGLVVLGLALYAGWTLGRRRLAWALAAVGSGAGLLVTTVVMPRFRDVGWHHLERLAPLADPGGKLLYLIQIAGLLLFLPLLAPRPLLAVLPTTLLNLSVDFENQYSGAFHYDDQNSVFWLVAAAHGALVAAPRVARWWEAWPSPWRSRLRRAGRLLAPAVLVAAIGSAALVLHRVVPTAAEREARIALTPYLALPDGVPIVVESRFGSHFAHRSGYRKYRDLGTARAPEGTLVLLPGEALRRRRSASRWSGELQRQTSRMEPVEIHPVLEVYRWRSSEADPPPKAVDRGGGSAPISGDR